MKRIVLPAHTGCRLPFFLAAEEWVARNLPAGDYFFLWRVNPTVICGRNQDITKEVNLDYCRMHDIEVVRRKSGGGCVYADLDNWMISYITHTDEITSTFTRFTSLVARMLQSLGFNAMATGRNDIMISGRKVSGNSFYHFPGHAIAHGTMLYNIDFATMSQAITPSRAKLESKAVKSVQARVTSLTAEGIRMSVEEFGDYANRFLSDGNDAITLSPEDIAEIEIITKGYYDPVYRRGRHGKPADDEQTPAIIRSKRIENAGEFCVGIDTDDENRIRRMSLSGDFFVTGDIDCEIIAPLVGVTYDRQTLETAISGINPGKAIVGLSGKELLSLLL